MIECSCKREQLTLVIYIECNLWIVLRIKYAALENISHLSVMKLPNINNNISSNRYIVLLTLQFSRVRRTTLTMYNTFIALHNIVLTMLQYFTKPSFTFFIKRCKRIHTTLYFAQIYYYKYNT